MTSWEYVKEFYRLHFGIDEWVVELYANLDILALCASGASNKTITTLIDVEIDDVVEVLMNTFQFPGWPEDLPISPYKLYLDLEKDNPENLESLFIAHMMASLRFYKGQAVKSGIPYAYHISKTMKELEERIADEWI